MDAGSSPGFELSPEIEAQLTKGGPAARAQANLAALETLERVEREGRRATDGLLGALGRMTRPRLVLDTSVLLSALLFPAGAVSWTRAAWRAGRIRPLASRDTTTELLRVLVYPKFGLAAGERRDLLDEYLPRCETIAIPDPPPPVPACRDPFDRPFLELARAAGRADALATGDADLLALADSFSVPILTPAALRRRLPYTANTDAR